MYKTIVSISSLLVSIAILIMGGGLLTTLLALRASVENYSGTTIGIMMSMYYAGFIAGTFTCPGIIHRVGHIRAFTAMTAFATCMILVQGIWVNAFAWTVMRFLTGMCFVGIYMIIESWLNEQSTNSIRGRVFACYMLVMLLALAIGQYLILLDDVMALTLFAVAAALVSLGAIPVALTRLHQPAPITPIEPGFIQLYRKSALGFTGCLMAGLLGGSFWSLGPLFALWNGMTQFEIAVFMSATVLGGALLQYPLGMWSDHADRRKILVYLGFGCTVFALLALLVLATMPGVLAICMFVYGGMMFSIYPVSVAHTNDHPEVTDIVSTTSNLLLVNGMGAAIGPVMGGILMQLLGRNSLLIMFSVFGALLGVYALYWKRYGVSITPEDKTSFVPLSRTTQVAIEGINTETKDADES